MEDYYIREAEKEEIEVIVRELWRPLAQEMEEITDYNELTEDALEKSIKHNNEQIADSDTIIYVAENNENLVGFVKGHTKQPAPIFSKGNYVKISNIYVKKCYRREGIAKALFERITSWAETQECEAIELSVDRENKKAINFYRNLGLTEVRKRMRKEI